MRSRIPESEYMTYRIKVTQLENGHKEYDPQVKVKRLWWHRWESIPNKAGNTIPTTIEGYALDSINNHKANNKAMSVTYKYIQLDLINIS
jgi:hypothetical protein